MAELTADQKTKAIAEQAKLLEAVSKAKDTKTLAIALQAFAAQAYPEQKIEAETKTRIGTRIQAIAAITGTTDQDNANRNQAVYKFIHEFAVDPKVKEQFKQAASAPAPKADAPAVQPKELTDQERILKDLDQKLKELKSIEKQGAEEAKRLEKIAKVEAEIRLNKAKYKLIVAKINVGRDPSQANQDALKAAEEEVDALQKEAGGFSLEGIKKWFSDLFSNLGTGEGFTWSKIIGGILGFFLASKVGGMFTGILGDGPLMGPLGSIAGIGIGIVGAFFLSKMFGQWFGGESDGPAADGQGRGRSGPAQAVTMQQNVGIVTEIDAMLAKENSPKVKYEKDLFLIDVNDKKLHLVAVGTDPRSGNNFITRADLVKQLDAIKAAGKTAGEIHASTFGGTSAPAATRTAAATTDNAAAAAAEAKRKADADAVTQAAAAKAAEAAQKSGVQFANSAATNQAEMDACRRYGPEFLGTCSYSR